MSTETTTVTEEQKSEMLAQVAMGETVPNVAAAYGIEESHVYRWIMDARQRQLKERPTTTAKPVISTTHAPAITLDEQMDALTKEFMTKLKDILKRQILNNIRTL